MNALEAMIKLEELKKEVTALKEAVEVMREHKASASSINTIHEMKKVRFEHQKALEEALKKIELPLIY